METIGTLIEGEVHPAAHEAFRFIKEYLLCDIKKTMGLVEAFASTALSGNRLSEICGETLRRIMKGEPVSDRYLLGLAWTLRTMGEDSDKVSNKRDRRTAVKKPNKDTKRATGSH